MFQATAFQGGGFQASIPLARRASGFRNAPQARKRWYLIDGQKLLLTDREFAQLIYAKQARIQDVQRLKRNKPKTISAETARAIEAIIQSLNLPVEPIQQTITPQIDNDDDEVMELLLTL